MPSSRSPRAWSARTRSPLIEVEVPCRPPTSDRFNRHDSATDGLLCPRRETSLARTSVRLLFVVSSTHCVTSSRSSAAGREGFRRQSAVVRETTIDQDELPSHVRRVVPGKKHRDATISLSASPTRPKGTPKPGSLVSPRRWRSAIQFGESVTGAITFTRIRSGPHSIEAARGSERIASFVAA